MRRRRYDSYVHRRQGTYQFRFQIAAPITALVGRSEIRLSLNTSELSIARERVAPVLPQVYAFKRLCTKVGMMTPDDSRRALRSAITRIVETLENWGAPWVDRRNDRERIPEYLEWKLLRESFPEWPDIRTVLGLELNRNVTATQPGTESRGALLARAALKTLGIDASEDSTLFAQLTSELERLQAGLHQVMEARSSGDRRPADDLIAYYRQMGLAPKSAAIASPPIRDAWREYAAEKTTGPKPAWIAKNAGSQEATFAEFREIVGDLHVGEITRDVILKYRNAVARLPSNRQKRYPGKSIAELLTMDTPADQRPSPRTIDEKLIRIGAWINWCRDVKSYLTTDPLRSVHIEYDSKSYAPFNQEDLGKLFNSPEYVQGKHLQSWQYWIPLIALYSGARQSEIAQLLVRDVIQDDGVWIFAVTDMDDDQHVKTSAGIRKVPVSNKLIELGFLDYVAFLRSRGETRLFPDLKKGRDGWGTRVSRWFGDVYKKNTGIDPDPTGRRKVFHSFRHTAITKALNKGKQNLPHTQQVFGHEKSLLMLGESATYMGEFAVSDLAPVIEALDWGLDHSNYAKTWRDYVQNWPGTFTSADCTYVVKQAA